ncbi:class III lanthionine synthetase LanKC [Streptomyces orinoci]|uniref:Class III lanthionine synthetase LanKC n=1 Tax=Streptomyces orinoci TaxID=67339 RepID=A0ABV3JVC9_STRON|nr:class III lanthionine synthetase LanKC [Streptomyces orinoci]
MDKRYEVYCLADGQFYETPDRLAGIGEQGSALYETARRPVPGGWESARTGDWLHLFPSGKELPAQGWKIHVAATADTAEKTAATVWDYCVARGIPFKFVPAPHLLHLRNSKYAGRDMSGKAVTIYPSDERQLELTLNELQELIGGWPGPYILTDLRWHEGPLYVRYGAFARRFCVDERGRLVPAVEDGEGKLVPDGREPAFRVPEWVTLPEFLRPQLAARNATTVGELPYTIDKALHFSNGGGVYTGTDRRNGRKVVLKEGRPYAGLASDGADAVARLEREKAALERLSGLGVAPEVRDWFQLGDHRFLVMDFVEGRALNSFFAERHPLLAARPDPKAVADYTRWALRVHRAVEEAVTAVHSRGMVFNDLHMFNVMVAPDEQSVALIDFEAAADAADNGRQVVAHPGFFAPPDRRGVEVDRYALACLRLALFLPVTTLLVIDRQKAAHLAEVIAAEFPEVPREFLDEAVREITRTADGTGRIVPPIVPPSGSALPDTADWPAARDSMVRGILASATVDRDDRLFPGDVEQFSDGGGLGLAHGAAGVLHALAEVGAERYEAGEDWLLRHTAPPPAGTPLGLYDGLAGVALVLDRLGHRERALELVESVLAERWQRLTPDLRGGLAGIGLVLERLAHTTGESRLAQRAEEAARLLAERQAADLADRERARRGRAGLLRGASGPALLFLRLYERTADPALLDLAKNALRLDLAHTVLTPSGSRQVDEKWRTMPYLGDGSVGIAMVLDELLAHTEDEELARARAEILPAACSRFYAQPGLFQGRAGMILHLSRTTTPGDHRAALAAQVGALGWYGMSYRGELAFPGHQMMRLSMDLATGTAGCLLALGAALDDRPVRLPFL